MQKPKLTNIQIQGYIKKETNTILKFTRNNKHKYLLNTFAGSLYYRVQIKLLVFLKTSLWYKTTSRSNKLNKNA